MPDRIIWRKRIWVQATKHETLENIMKAESRYPRIGLGIPTKKTKFGVIDDNRSGRKSYGDGHQ